MTRPLGARQEAVLDALIRHRTYPGGWYWDNHSTTVEILDSLVKRGLASAEVRTARYTGDSYNVYRPTEAGYDARPTVAQRIAAAIAEREAAK